MKNLSLLILSSAFSLISCAQNSSVNAAPAVVVNAFKSQFPKANDVEWEKKGSNYEVEFETGITGKDHKMLIDSTGKVIFHKQDISAGDLPQAVTEAINKNFPAYRQDDIKQIEKDGVTSYKLEVKKQGEEWKVVFDKNGKLLDKIPD